MYFVLGKGNATLIYSGGELTLTLLGGKDNCHGSYTRQTVIKFSCDHSTDGRGGPIFIRKYMYHIFGLKAGFFSSICLH